MTTLGALMVRLISIESRLTVAPRWLFMLVMVISGAKTLLAKEGVGWITSVRSIEAAKTLMRRIGFKSDRLIQEGG